MKFISKFICLLRGHDNKFLYNYGVPLGCSWEEWDRLTEKGLAYPVYRCKRCKRKTDSDGKETGIERL